VIVCVQSRREFLRSAGALLSAHRSLWNISEISVLMSDTGGTRDIGHVKATKAPEGATTGATTGSVTGGVLGLLTGVGALAISGLGPFIAAGPIMAALSGAAVGATTGGVVGGLVASA
jgi:hypothetical protein